MQLVEPHPVHHSVPFSPFAPSFQFLSSFFLVSHLDSLKHVVSALMHCLPVQSPTYTQFLSSFSWSATWIRSNTSSFVSARTFAMLEMYVDHHSSSFTSLPSYVSRSVFHFLMHCLTAQSPTYTHRTAAQPFLPADQARVSVARCFVMTLTCYTTAAITSFLQHLLGIFSGPEVLVA